MPDIEKRIDDDWKRRAQLEKEALTEKAKPTGATAAAATDVKPSQAFMTLVSQLTQQAAYYLGMVDDPRMGPVPPDLQAAQAVIGMLEVLELRTRGNLAKDETKFLADALSELRLAYVEATRAARK